MFTALNNLQTVNADEINSYNLDVSNETTLNNATVKTLTVTDELHYPLNYKWLNLIDQSPALLGTNHLVQTEFSDNITQTNGSTELLDTTIGSITQSGTSVIIQSGNQWNQLKQTQVTDLSITGTLTLPSNVVIAGSTYNDDLIMNNATIQQTAPTSMINTFSATDFYNGDVRLNKNLTMIGGADTQATLKNLVVEGNSALNTITGYTITDLDTRITTNKNDITAINTNLALKADKTYVDNQLVLKADKTYVDNQLVLKDDITSVNTKLALKADKTYTDTQLALKADKNNTTLTGTTTASVIKLVASTGAPRGQIYIPQSSGELIFYYGSNFSQGSRISYSAGNVMFWDNYASTNIQYRYGLNSDVKQVFYNNGDVSITGNILNSPTITGINSSIALKADKTYTDTQLALKDSITSVDSKLVLKADKTYVDTQLLLKDDVTSVNSKLLLKDDITSVDSKCLILQTQIDDIIASEYYESIAIGTITTLDPGEPATVVNSGTNINAILDFGIPMGYKGDKGDKGDRGPSGDDGKDGSDGTNGSDGAPGDSSAATISAGIAAGAAAAAAAEAGVAVAAASASAASAASAAASAALANGKNLELETKVTGLQTQVDTLGQGMTQLDNDVIALKTKTQYMTAGVGITTINSTLNTNDINANNLYIANDLIVVDEVKASKFSGGFLSTQIGGSNINIGTGESLINNINIGSMSSLVTINGFLYNPYFSNTNSISQF